MSWLMRRFGPRISVDVSRERFVWRWRDREVTLRPMIYVDSDRRILAVGEPPASAHTAVRALDDPQALEKFVKFGFERVLGRSLTIKPNVRVTGAARLGPPMAADIERALRRSGAGTVEVGE